MRQFLDIGTGLPSVDNTHEIAQRVAPECRIVYVDNDPLVLAHARALLTSSPEGVTHYVDADLRDPDTIVREAAGTLDFGRPIALMLMGILGHIEDYDEAREIVRRLVAALPRRQLPRPVRQHRHQPGLRRRHPPVQRGRVDPVHPPHPRPDRRLLREPGTPPPGVTSCSRWRPDDNAWGLPAEVHQYGGVALKR